MNLLLKIGGGVWNQPTKGYRCLGLDCTADHCGHRATMNFFHQDLLPLFLPPIILRWSVDVKVHYNVHISYHMTLNHCFGPSSNANAINTSSQLGSEFTTTPSFRHSA